MSHLQYISYFLMSTLGAFSFGWFIADLSDRKDWPIIVPLMIAPSIITILDSCFYFGGK